MAREQSPKKGKKPTKKAVAKRGVVKSTTPRKASKQLNQRRLQRDIQYYQEEMPTDINRYVQKSKKNPRGIPLRDFEPIYKHGGRTGADIVRYETNDGKYTLTPIQYHLLTTSRYSVPIYTPVHGKTKSGKRTIKRFRNSITGETVTPYYYYNYFTKEFKKTGSEELDERYSAFEESLRQAKYTRLRRNNDLEDSYSLVHPEYVDAKGNVNRTAIRKDPVFITLVDRLEQLHASAYVNQQVVRETDIALGGSYDDDTVAEELEILKTDIGENLEYQNVLVLLGRRLPGDTNPVGDSDPNHIKFTVRPYYEALHNIKTFEE